jgi:ABC-type lipoprotein export system ATPase subunit
MQLTLTNFRCYAGARTFCFDEPFVYVVGKSGAGKTTVLDGLIFTLYGKGKNLASLATVEPYEAELALEDGTRIRRTKTRLIWADAGADATFSDSVAQDKIDKMFGRFFFSYSQSNVAQFLEMAPREQLETLETVLFNDELDIKALKAKFNAEKRTLDGVQNQLSAQRGLVLDFLRKLGHVDTVANAHSDADEIDLKARLYFLRNRVYIRNLYTEKKELAAREIADLECKIAAARAGGELPYSKEQVVVHLEAAKQLQKLGWRDYLGYSVADCEEEIQNYQCDEAVLACADSYACPSCGSSLCLKEGKLALSAGDSEKTRELLDDLGAASVADGLREVRRQISLYENYKKKREAIDEWKQELLPIENAEAVYRALLERERVGVEASVLEAQLAQRRRYLETLQAEARAADVANWGHEQEIDEISQSLQHAELYEMRAKESQIRADYEAQLADLATKVALCASRQQGLVRASVIFAQTEQQYLQEMIEQMTADLNRLMALVFEPVREVALEIDATAGGARKLRITFDRDYTYDMFSGGEKARINLCFLVVLARFQRFKILLLDEFTRFLDKETIARVTLMLTENFEGQIIAAEHECPEQAHCVKVQEVE